MTGRLRVAVLVWLVVAATVTVASPAAAATHPETDSTVTRITVAANGTATWQVQVRTRLTSEADVDEYERFQAQFRDNTSAFLDPFRDRMRGVVTDAANATGRPMRAENFEGETSIQVVPRRWGVVTYEFTWAHFAAHDGEALVVGDVFRGQFFLTQNDTLEVVGPQDYAVATVEPSPAEQEPGVVRWSGPRSFPEDQPFVRFEPELVATQTSQSGAELTGTSAVDSGSGRGTAATTAAAPGGPNGNRVTTTPAGAESAGSPFPAAAAVLLVGLLAVGAYRYYGRSGSSVLSGGTDGGATGSSPAADSASTESKTDSADAIETDTESAAGAAAAPTAGERASQQRSDAASSGGAGGGDTRADDSGAASYVDPTPVVTDDERVEEFLDVHGGQVRQSEIVDGLDWSKSKTSRVLSDMADEGSIEKLRIGRENVIRLPEQSSDGTGRSE